MVEAGAGGTADRGIRLHLKATAAIGTHNTTIHSTSNTTVLTFSTKVKAWLDSSQSGAPARGRARTPRWRDFAGVFGDVTQAFGRVIP